MTIISYQLFFVGFFDIYYVYIKILNYSSFGLIKPHKANFSNPPSPYTGCRCLSASSVATRQCSNEIRHCSRCSRPSPFHLRWNTMRLPDDPCGCSPSSTFRVPRQSGDGYNAGGYFILRRIRLDVDGISCNLSVSGTRCNYLRRTPQT